MIHRSPKNARGRTPWFFSSIGRVSVACLNSSMRVSACRRLPKKKGELAARATCGAHRACAAFQWAANSDGVTWRWSWTDVQADSGAMESQYVATRSPEGPSMSR